jgi:uncharacterized membrane protein YqjE
MHNGCIGGGIVVSDSSTQIDPSTGIPDLVRSLADDSKRLAADEVRLAKLELHDSVKMGTAGAVRLALAAAFAIVAAVALTLLLIAVVAAALDDKYWAGALIVGAVEAGIGLLALRRGMKAVRSPAYALRASREQLKDTATWVRQQAKR